MACVEFNFGGTVISTNLDITEPLNIAEVISKIKGDRENNVFTINGQETSGDLYETLVSTLEDKNARDNTYNFSKKRPLSETLIGNTSINSSRFPHLNTSDNNVLIVDSNVDISQNYFFSKNRMFSIGTQSNKKQIENIAYIYNEIKSENMAWIRLINQLVEDSDVRGDVYEKLEYLVNVDSDKLIPLFKFIPNENASITFNNETYTLKNNKWMFNDVEITDDDLIFNLWKRYISFTPKERIITPIKISDIIDSLSTGDILVAVDGTVLTHTAGEIFTLNNEPVAENTKIKGYIKIKNKNLRDYLFLTTMPDMKIKTSRLDAIVRQTLADYAFNSEGEPIYTFHNKPTKIQDNGVVAINSELYEHSNPCLLYIPVIFNNYIHTHPGIKFTIAGEDVSYNTVLKELIKYSNVKKNNVGAIDNVEDIKNIFTEVSKSSANGTQLNSIERNIAVLYAPKTIKTVSEKLIKQLISENKLINYCKL